jgi:hypothetical protein
MFNKGYNCPDCELKVKDSFDFCPYCGLDLVDPEKDLEEFGALGRNDSSRRSNLENQGGGLGLGGFGITDKMIGSLIKNLAKSFEKQMGNIDAEVKNLPNGVSIQFGVPGKPSPGKSKKNQITSEQIKRMSKLPREEAKTEVKRFSDRVVYQLIAKDIASVEDVFVSKLETGYEIKAIGKKKVYVNSLPVSLPLKSYSLDSKGLSVEFGLQ